MDKFKRINRLDFVGLSEMNFYFYISKRNDSYFLFS